MVETHFSARITGPYRHETKVGNDGSTGHTLGHDVRYFVKFNAVFTEFVVGEGDEDPKERDPHTNYVADDERDSKTDAVKVELVAFNDSVWVKFSPLEYSRN